MQCRPRQREEKKWKSKHAILNKMCFQAIYEWLSNTFLGQKRSFMTFEANKYGNLISKSGYPNLNALKSVCSILRWPPMLLGSTPMSFYYKNSIFFQSFSAKNKWQFEKWYFHIFLLGFRRKLTALTLCKSIESAIQWFQIHHRITFAPIPNSAVNLSGARVSIFPTVIPQLIKYIG